METYMQMLGRLAKSASREAAKLGTKAKNRGLLAVANELVEERELILQENAKDIEAAEAKGVKQSLIDRWHSDRTENRGYGRRSASDRST